MSILTVMEQEWTKQNSTDSSLTLKSADGRFTAEKALPSDYQPTGEEKDIRSMIVDSFRWADVVMRKPRREWNDMSTLYRMMYDQMAFNIYQPNNGQGFAGDEVNSWKSHAVKPIVRNKVISIAAHATARLLFPKIFAFNEQSEEQEDAAEIMRNLVEWASDQNEYRLNTLHATINACVNPASITHLEYAERYRVVKTKKENGKWQTEEILDEDNSGFTLTQVPVDELYVADFYTKDIQDQEYVIWRRVISYANAKSKHGHKDNFKYVKPGIQVIYNDANIAFYEVYDSNLRSNLVEEIIFYSKDLDLQVSTINGIMMDEPDNPIPRIDKKYPFIKFYYEPLDEGRCFYGKSLAFKMQPDADIINSLYPMIIDGTYLNIFNPMIVAGEESIGADVMIPGTMTTLTNPAATVVPLRVAQDIRQGVDTLFKVEESINQSSQAPIISGQQTPGSQTAYEISKMEQNAKTVLGPFLEMIGDYVKQYGELIESDILQHLTIPDVNKIVDNGELIYKTIIAHDVQGEGSNKSKKIKFDINLPEEVSEEEELNKSYDLLEEQGGEDSNQEICEVNPKLFRKLKYITRISPDVLNPMSDELERAFGLETFDKSIIAAQTGVPVDMEEAYKDFVLWNNPKARRDINKYLKKPEELSLPGLPQENPQMQGQPGQPQQQPMGLPNAGKSPFASAITNPLMGK